ncbi:retrovirus-related Pol polyprotein from transposon TNT 1-94 [Trichonephila clavipes]|nr:retrovirus-related Pol polyprotein from transposon TNT 1-94 [Trichonephila clavipes]
MGSKNIINVTECTKGRLDLRFASARCLEIVCGTIATPTSARIVERVTVGSTSACITILRSSLLVVFLVAPDLVFRAWVPSRVHCSQQFLTAHSERSTWPATRHVDQPAVFIPMIRPLSNSLNCEKCLLGRLPDMFRLPKFSYNRRSRTIFMNSVASTLNRVTGMEFNNQISVLTPNNWNTWKHDMQVLLMHYGCWQFIIQTKPEQPDEEATYKEKLDLQLRKDRCYTLIYTNISSDLKNLITETTDGVAAWKILKDHFEPVTKARVIQLLDQFFGTKYQPGEDVGIFISRVKTVATRLQEAGHKLDDLYIGFQLIRWLPQEFQSTVQQIYRWKEEDFRVVKIEAELILEANRLQLMKQDLEKAENAYLSSFTSKKSKTLPGATAAAHGDPNGKNDYQKKGDGNKLVETINVRFDENKRGINFRQKVNSNLGYNLNLPDYYDDEDDFDRVKDSLTSRLVSKTSTETPSTSEKPDVSSDNHSLIPCTEVKCIRNIALSEQQEALMVEVTIPNCYKQAIRSRDASKWHDAMDKEINMHPLLENINLFDISSLTEENVKDILTEARVLPEKTSANRDSSRKLVACVRESTLEFFTLLNAKGKKELIEWCMKEGLIASSYECPKCNDQHDETWSAIKRFLRNRASYAECMFDHYLAE